MLSRSLLDRHQPLQFFLPGSKNSRTHAGLPEEEIHPIERPCLRHWPVDLTARADGILRDRHWFFIRFRELSRGASRSWIPSTNGGHSPRRHPLFQLFTPIENDGHRWRCGVPCWHERQKALPVWHDIVGIWRAYT